MFLDHNVNLMFDNEQLKQTFSGAPLLLGSIYGVSLPRNYIPETTKAHHKTVRTIFRPIFGTIIRA